MGNAYRFSKSRSRNELERFVCPYTRYSLWHFGGQRMGAATLRKSFYQAWPFQYKFGISETPSIWKFKISRNTGHALETLVTTLMPTREKLCADYQLHSMLRRIYGLLKLDVAQFSALSPVYRYLISISTQ
jgi:hypothetical protein